MRRCQTPSRREPSRSSSSARWPAADRRNRPAPFVVRVKEGHDMRFMMIVKANEDSEAGVMPDEKLIAEMTKYNEELAKAGVLLDLAGLQPSSKGMRVRFA